MNKVRGLTFYMKWTIERKKVEKSRNPTRIPTSLERPTTNNIPTHIHAYINVTLKRYTTGAVKVNPASGSSRDRRLCDRKLDAAIVEN